MRVVLLLLGLALAATGGTIAYRAAFLEARDTILVAGSDAPVRELPDMLRLGGGIALLLMGALVAFISARRLPR